MTQAVARLRLACSAAAFSKRPPLGDVTADLAVQIDEPLAVSLNEWADALDLSQRELVTLVLAAGLEIVGSELGRLVQESA